MTTTAADAIREEIEEKRKRLSELFDEVNAIQCERISLRNEVAILSSRLAQLEGAS